MRIAIASCMCTNVFSDQPVWEQIAAQQPDHLVLLGDSLYLDINTATHPQDMDDNDFGQHLFNRYTELLAQPQFTKLVQQLPAGRVHTIWDDHDFLWDNAQGGGISVMHQGKVRTSTGFQEVFRATLAARQTLAGFPTSYSDPRFWNPGQPSLTTPSIKLDNDVYLHLSDVRTFRTGTWLISEAKRTLLGPAQRAQIEAAVKAAPGALHLLASGSTMADWKRYASDLRWLLDLAANQRTLVLSGDIHRNEVDAFYTGGWPLHEVTSSGAAVRDAVVVGARQQNYGLLDIKPDTVQVRLFHFGAEQTSLARTYDRTTWLPR